VIVVVIGGMRSGKSDVAQRIAAKLGEPVTVAVTASIQAGDADFAARIAAHRSGRPSSWTTVECGTDLIAAIAPIEGTLLVDSLGTWLSATPEFAVDLPGLLTTLSARNGATVVVSDEVGLSVHPTTELGRRFADALGAVNAAVVDLADHALLVVAGRALRLQRFDTSMDEI
jgi:adenosylcobinamide kinase/adenosylcobinamide-phosphate guanylyltransferase